MTERQVGFVELIRGNQNLRRIWFAEIASQLGDWFNLIALYTLVERLTGSPLALGWVFVIKTLAFALASPFAGLLADRLNRRRLMIACDLSRGVLVLGFLLVDEAGELPLLYGLAMAQMVFAATFMPARNASIPNVTSPRELLTANALLAATWSTLLALGAALGGLVAAWLGLHAVFVIDSFSYFVSAFFLLRTVIPQQTEKASGSLVREALRGVWEGWSYLVTHPHVARIALVKTTWAVGGAGLVYMLALLGTRLVPGAASVGIGLLYAVRGVGTGVGPLAARAWLPEKEKWPVFFGIGICFSGLAYWFVGWLPWTFWILPLVFLAHMPSGANWAFSSVLLQERAPDRVRGRVFASEWLLLTLLDAIVIFTASMLLEREVLSLRQGFQVFAAIQVVCGVLWLVLAVPRERVWRQGLGEGLPRAS